ncbi:hypothetical protein BH18ACI1_BH18ACI1_17520 [soil metagenome]
MEKRGNNSYYYKKVRRGGGVFSEYVGSGEVAHFIAQFDAHRRERREFERQKELEIKQKLDEKSLEIEQIHLHNAEHRGITGRLALPIAPKMLGNVAALAFESWININSYSSDLRREATRIEANNLLENLGYETANLLEQILMQEIVICWLRVNYLSETQKLKLNQSHTTESGLYWTKQVEIAQKQFTRACESLAKVHKLLNAANAKSSEMVKNLFEANLAKTQAEFGTSEN